MKSNLRYWALISISILLIPFLYGIHEADAATWYNSSWLKARKITIDQTKIDTADLTNYPLYVNMTSVDIGTDAQADCDDFVFTDSTNVTKLDHEIELCNAANNWAEFWVEIPTVSNTVDTVIYMYYDNAAATDQQNTQGTWNSNFASVHHLNATFLDSTSNANTCSNVGTSATTSQYIGDSRSWDGVNDNIACGSAASIDDIFTTGGTVSAWIKPATDGEGPAIIATKASVASGNGWGFRLVTNAGSATQLEFLTRGATTPVWTSNANSIKFGGWSLVVVTYNSDASGNDPLLYVNGTSVALTQTGIDLVYVSDAANLLCLGNRDICTTQLTATFDGPMDEFRLNNAILTPEWIKADWECQMGATQNSIGPAISCINVGSQGTEPTNPIVTVSDEYALEDLVSIVTAGSVTVSDEFALEDSVSIPGSIIVTDEFALEDSASTNQVTVSDEFALEDSVQGSTPAAPIPNAIVLYVNKSPFTFGIYSDATRMSCSSAIKGGVIFNTNDLNLNICNGVSWILPNGTAT